MTEVFLGLLRSSPGRVAALFSPLSWEHLWKYDGGRFWSRIKSGICFNDDWRAHASDAEAERECLKTMKNIASMRRILEGGR